MLERQRSADLCKCEACWVYRVSVCLRKAKQKQNKANNRWVSEQVFQVLWYTTTSRPHVLLSWSYSVLSFLSGVCQLSFFHLLFCLILTGSLQSEILIYLLISLFLFMCVYAHKCVCMLTYMAVPAEASREHWIPRQLWATLCGCWELNTGLLTRAAHAPNHWLIPPDLTCLDSWWLKASHAPPNDIKNNNLTGMLDPFLNCWLSILTPGGGKKKLEEKGESGFRFCISEAKSKYGLIKQLLVGDQ